MTKLILAAVTLTTVVSSAEAKIALNGVALNGVQVRQLSVNAVILPSGEIVNLR